VIVVEMKGMEMRDWKRSQLKRLAVLLGVALFCVIGCSKRPSLPQLNPVHGKVVFSDGKPVHGGSVWFKPQNDPHVTTRGEIEPNGAFTLSSFMAGGHGPGAIAGPHRVTVTVELEGRFREMVIPHSAKAGASPKTTKVPETRTVTLPDVYTVKPGDNDFTLTVSKGTP
jgi:hypothetical protein